MNEHTPGPWACDLDMAKVYSVPTNLMVASISIPTNTACKDAWPADARLIAAAPDLLDAAQWLMTYEQAMNEDRDIEAMTAYAEASRRARAAIAKAEGRT